MLPFPLHLRAHLKLDDNDPKEWPRIIARFARELSVTSDSVTNWLLGGGVPDRWEVKVAEITNYDFGQWEFEHAFQRLEAVAPDFVLHDKARECRTIEGFKRVLEEVSKLLLSGDLARISGIDVRVLGSYRANTRSPAAPRVALIVRAVHLIFHTLEQSGKGKEALSQIPDSPPCEGKRVNFDDIDLSFPLMDNAVTVQVESVVSPVPASPARMQSEREDETVLPCTTKEALTKHFLVVAESLLSLLRGSSGEVPSYLKERVVRLIKKIVEVCAIRDDDVRGAFQAERLPEGHPLERLFDPSSGRGKRS
jgi:hypothetical protein